MVGDGSISDTYTIVPSGIVYICSGIIEVSKFCLPHHFRYMVIIIIIVISLLVYHCS